MRWHVSRLPGPLVDRLLNTKAWQKLSPTVFLTSNQMIFLVQFEIYKHSQIFQRLQIAVFEKFVRAYISQIALEII